MADPYDGLPLPEWPGAPQRVVRLVTGACLEPCSPPVFWTSDSPLTGFRLVKTIVNTISILRDELVLRGAVLLLMASWWIALQKNCPPGRPSAPFRADRASGPKVGRWTWSSCMEPGEHVGTHIVVQRWFCCAIHTFIMFRKDHLG